MPSLIRFIVLVIVLGVIGVAGMLALTTFVEPNPREMSVRVKIDDLS